MNDGKQEVRQKSCHSIWTLGTLSSLDFRKYVLDEDEDTGPSKPLPGAGAAITISVGLWHWISC